MFAGDIVVYLKNPRRSTEKLLEAVSVSAKKPSYKLI